MTRYRKFLRPSKARSRAASKAVSNAIKRDKERSTNNRVEELENKVRELETFLSEDVAPYQTEDNQIWKETLKNGAHVPVMRGSPNLTAFIVRLHDLAAHRAEAFEALREALKYTMTALRDARDTKPNEWHALVTPYLCNAWDANKAALALADKVS